MIDQLLIKEGVITAPMTLHARACGVGNQQRLALSRWSRYFLAFFLFICFPIGVFFHVVTSNWLWVVVRSRRSVGLSFGFCTDEKQSVGLNTKRAGNVSSSWPLNYLGCSDDGRKSTRRWSRWPVLQVLRKRFQEQRQRGYLTRSMTIGHHWALEPSSRDWTPRSTRSRLRLTCNWKGAWGHPFSCTSCVSRAAQGERKAETG